MYTSNKHWVKVALRPDEIGTRFNAECPVCGMDSMPTATACWCCGAPIRMVDIYWREFFVHPIMQDALDKVSKESTKAPVENKYTAINMCSYGYGSARFSMPNVRRIIQKDGETVGDMLRREGILESAVFLFHGHPKMEGE